MIRGERVFLAETDRTAQCPPSCSPHHPHKKRKTGPKMSDENALFGLENQAQNGGNSGHFGQGPTETDTRTALDEIEAGSPFTGAKRTIKQLCIALAVSIDKGNTKGRAIANEAGQLLAMMNQLDPTDPAENGASTLDPETERLFNGFASGPRLETAPEDADAPGRDDSPEL